MTGAGSTLSVTTTTALASTWLVPRLSAGTLRFSHYDQVIQSAVGGNGVAIGKWPHLASHLREGTLVAPLGMEWLSSLGAFYVVTARGAAQRDDVASFVAWLEEETRRDAEHAPAPIRSAKRKAARVR